ncbi:SRPBCC domain-containing protein [Leucobacter sp. BZR 635]
MSKFTASAATMYSLSLAGMEEASRTGLRDADLEHLLLALTMTEQDAGKVLRGAGVTLEVTREAVAEQHAEQLRALGVDHEPPQPGPIVFHETGGYEWTDRAQDVWKRASKNGLSGDASAVLRALLEEPSGLIEAVLERLGVTSGELLARLAAAERIPSFGEAPRPARGPYSRSLSSFVPAPIESVWALLADPARMPEWDELIGVVHLPDELGERALQSGDAWGAEVVTHFPNGKPNKQPSARRRLRIELLAFDEPGLISWQLTFPAEPTLNARRITISLEPAAGGTQLRVTFEWVPAAQRRRVTPVRRVQRFLLKPATSFAVWLQATRVGSGISRALRSGAEA